jgi:hypothetical protein
LIRFIARLACGEVSERFKEHAWKACVGEILPWVRIPPSPFPLDSKRRKMLHHNNFRPNCTCRELVAVDVIIAAVGDGPPVGAAYTTGLGVLKLV